MQLFGGLMGTLTFVEVLRSAALASEEDVMEDGPLPSQEFVDT